jgi:2-dehydro-3-deoxygalactonokinase
VTTALLGLDWGSTCLRAYRYGDSGQILEARAFPYGVRRLPPGGFAQAFAESIRDWPEVPVLACGMVGSRNGWLEVPYLPTPAGIEGIARALTVMTAPAGRLLYLVPGLRDPKRPDVMRGEETQIVGVLAQHQESLWRGTLLLPGTHSKWASIDDGMVTGFATMMTGELYELLTCHSSLAAPTTTATVGDESAFTAGVRAARDSGPAGALSRLFSARVRMLDGDLAPTSVADYLSGLLIGDEFRTAFVSGWIDNTAQMQIVGDAALCSRYQQAASIFGLSTVPTPEATAAMGLWHIATEAGLLATART